MPYRKQTWIKLIQKVPEPRSVPFFYAAIYAALLIAGVSVLIQPPSSIQSEIGPILSYAWGGFLATGSFIGLSAVLTPAWWLERIGILLAGSGAAVYAGIALIMHFGSEGNRIPQLMFILVALCALLVRFIRIRQAAYEPGK